MREHSELALCQKNGIYSAILLKEAKDGISKQYEPVFRAY